MRPPAANHTLLDGRTGMPRVQCNFGSARIHRRRECPGKARVIQSGSRIPCVLEWWGYAELGA